MDLGELYVPHAGWFTHEAGDEVARFLSEGWFEYKEQAFLRLYLRPGDIFVDCGAHVGLFSVVAGRAVGNSGTIIAMEPHPESATLLDQNLRANGVGCARVRQAAVLSHDVSAGLHLGSRGRAAYSSVSAIEDSRVAIQVQGVTLDSLLSAEEISGTVDLAKVDVEGAELEVLAGAANSIREGRFPLFLIECTEANLRRFGAGTEALFQALDKNGYRVCRLDTGSCQLVDLPYTGAIGYDNLFAAQDIDSVNARLRAAPEAFRKVARDILSRGAASEILYRQAAQATKASEGAARSAGAAEEAFQAKAEAAWLAVQAEKRAADAERRRDEARAQALDSELRAAASVQQAEKSRKQAEESRVQVAQSQKQAEESRAQAAQSEKQAEESRAQTEESRKQAEESRAQAEQATQLASELRRRLEEIVASRPVRWGWKLGLAPKPAWVDDSGAVGPVTEAEASAPDPPAEVSAVAEAVVETAAETEMMRALRHLDEKGFRPRVVLDIGAGKGYWSIVGGAYFRDAEFYLLEPLLENEPDLRELCERDARQHYVLTAVGAESGARPILIAPEVDSSTMLMFPGADEARQRSIAVTTVDELLAKNRIPMPDLVRIDVQGMELEVLEGSQKLFAHAEVFIIGVNLFAFLPGCPRVHEVIRYMADRGYHLFDFAGSLRRPFEDDLAQLDLIMVSERSALIASNRWE